MNKLNAVYHGDHGLRALKELGRTYLTITRDQSRVMTRVKAVYRSWAIPCSGKQVYASRHRAEWLGKIQEPGVRRRAELYYQQLDALRTLRQHVGCEARKLPVDRSVFFLDSSFYRTYQALVACRKPLRGGWPGVTKDCRTDTAKTSRRGIS